MTSCPDCNIGLPDGVKRCPKCQRRLGVYPFARRILVAVLILLPIVGALGIALVSHKLESRLLWRQTSPSDAYRAAMVYMKLAPELRGAGHFSKEKESVIERWGPMRFRVSGQVDLTSAPGERTRNSYSCVLHFAGTNQWEVEDLHIERLQ